jgi:hypothetical protein
MPVERCPGQQNGDPEFFGSAQQLRRLFKDGRPVSILSRDDLVAHDVFITALCCALKLAKLGFVFEVFPRRRITVERRDQLIYIKH